MDNENILFGKLTDAFLDADVVKAGKKGAFYTDPSNGRLYRLLKNLGATAIAASECVIATTTDAAAGTFGVRANTTALSPCFAGVRPVGADSLAQNYWGWFQQTGPATLKFDTTGTPENVVASTPVVLDDNQGCAQGIDITPGCAGGSTPANTDVNTCISGQVANVVGIIGIAHEAKSTTGTFAATLKPGASVYAA